MRVIDTYTFYYGTKIPFSEIPDRIHRFFADQGLKSERFMYYFEDIAQYEPADEDAQNTEALKCVSSTHGCERILKDCPELGDIRFKQNPYRDRFSFLTNLDREPFPEETILPLMKKIHKYYGFFSTYLYYSDIDFFGETISYEPSLSGKDDSETEDFDSSFYWSKVNSPNAGIEIFRCSLTTDNYISLSVDSLFNGKLRDTTPYYHALRAILPKMRSFRETRIRLTREEKAILDSSNQKAAPILEKCRNFFRKFVPADCKLTEAWDGSGTAKAMKRIVESYGFSFKRTGNGVYKAEKRTPRNAVIYTELYAAEENAYMVVSFQSVGVKHELYCNMEIPSQNKGVINAHLKDAFAAIGEFEKTFLPELDNCFDTTPDWFFPSDYFEKERGGYHY